MSRNRKPDYIKKLMGMESNGYKFDVANYLYNPSYDYDYPSFKKLISSSDTEEVYNRVYYFKHYDGSGEYLLENFSYHKDPNDTSKNAWHICHDVTNTVLAKSNRFCIRELLKYCEIN